MSQFLDVKSSDVRKMIKGALGNRNVDSEATHGYDNHIVITDDHIVYRFPRNEAALQKIRLEKAVLDHIAGKISSVKVPIFGELARDPVWHVSYRFIQGVTLNELSIKRLSISNLEGLGRCIGRFVAELQLAISAKEFKAIFDKIVSVGSKSHFESWGDYLQRAISRNTNLAIPDEVMSMVRDDLERLHRSYPEGFDENVVTHDDLYGHNLVLDESNHLVAVIDFADIGLGDTSRELRQAWRTSLALFDSACAEYQQATGLEVDINKAELWSKTGEWAGLLSKWDDKDHPSYKRAATNLIRWYPTLKDYIMGKK